MKLVTIIGARPQFIKASSLSRALLPVCKEILVHTGQHYDDNMSGIFFKQLQLPKPDYNLAVGSASHGKQTAKMIEGIETILIKEKPDLILVYGDTNTTVAGSLAASKLFIPIVHVEAGLRSFNRRMPEEINRVVTDHLSSILFCPTNKAVKNLEHEGIRKHVYLVGDIMYDSVLYFKDIALKKSAILETLGLTPKNYIVATIHRQENTDQPDKLKKLFETIRQLDRTVVIPLHPRTEHLLHLWNLWPLLNSPNIKVCAPLAYLDMLSLIYHSDMILTDSGGLQKEAYMLQVPCITLREETEWVETVTTGWNHLAGIDPDRILNITNRLVIPDQWPAIFGDGKSAQRMCQIMQTYTHP